VRPPKKPFVIYRLGENDRLHEIVAEFEKLEDVRRPIRADRKHKIRVPGRKYLTHIEFDEWRKMHK
jgi:hypothetical protein